MEGMIYGWRKSISRYHFFPEYSTVSVCFKVTFDDSFSRKLEFFAETEITPDMNLCEECLSIRQQQVRDTIVRVSSSETHVLVERTCSEKGCNEKGVAYVSTKNEEKPHYCIKHNLRIKIAQKKILEASSVC